MDHSISRRIAFLGGYPPRLCGIATFNHDLFQAIKADCPHSDCFVVAVNDRLASYDYPPEVRIELDEKDIYSYRKVADYLNLNNVDILCIQHEFGIYGGNAGIHLLALLKEVRMPVITTLHTILSEPTPAQKLVMNELLKQSDRVVVMAKKGAEILQERYHVSAAKIDLISHGIPDSVFTKSSAYKAVFGIEGRHVLLTFGLLGPGKGIEYVVEALPEIVRHHPNVVYLILGATHPHLIEREGEVYRLKLERLAEDRGVKQHVIFYNRFVSTDDLQEFIGATDIYITPYLNEAQITSGTLARVFGSGKAVISTPYWHAKELLGDGRGTLVPFQDSAAIASAVCHYLDHPDVLETISQKAYEWGRHTIWSETAKQYTNTFRHALSDNNSLPRTSFGQWTLASRPYALPPLRLDHLIAMTNTTGIFQHASYTVPNFHEGYCTDDNARAFILATLLDDAHPHPNLGRQTTTYLAFLSAAFNYENGRFRNFMSHARHWMEESGSEDSHARALWALGVGAGCATNQGHQKLSADLFQKGIGAVETFSSPRAWAFSLLGSHDYLIRFPEDSAISLMRLNLTKKLLALWKNYATENWPWFEPSATYENARLCQALILSGQWIPNEEALAIGLRSLRWLVDVQKSPSGHFSLIGSNGFYPRGGVKEQFDQQPVEAQALVSACLEAFRATQDATWLQEAKLAFEWFLGRNDLGLSLYDASTGGCSDGLHSDRINENQGAESSLAFHLSLIEMGHIEHLKIHPLAASL